MYDHRLTPSALRQRATERLKRAVGGEAFSFSVQTGGSNLFYTGLYGTSYLQAGARLFEGHPLVGGAIHERQPGGWSLYRPLRAHANRFARIEEDQDLQRMKTKQAWRSFYGPYGIRDQLRTLLYDADGTFIGFMAACRGKEHSFDHAAQAALNREIPNVVDDFRLAWSLERAARIDASAHLIVDERGFVRFGGEVATTWLTASRREALRRRIGRVPRFFIDGVLFCGRRLEPHGDWYVSLTPGSGIRRSRLAELSDAQRSVFELAEKGMTNQEIADVLGLSASTVKYHLRTLYDALELGSRAELATHVEREHPVAHRFADHPEETPE